MCVILRLRDDGQDVRVEIFLVRSRGRNKRAAWSENNIPKAELCADKFPTRCNSACNYSMELNCPYLALDLASLQRTSIRPQISKAPLVRWM